MKVTIVKLPWSRGAENAAKVTLHDDDGNIFLTLAVNEVEVKERE